MVPRLEEAGCQVIYGLDGFKVHSKLCLVTRRENGKTEYFTQIGTGNYNEKTSRLYTDLSLMTADTAIGLEAAAVFQALAKGEAAVFATASLRNIANTDQALEQIQQTTGICVEVLSGEMEAECGYYGAITDVQVDDGLFVDIGGASAELALFAQGTLQKAGSVPVGSLKLYRDCVKKIMPGKESRQRIEKAVRKAFESSDLKDIPKETQIVGVGGTIRATLRLCKKLCGLPEDSRTFNREQLEELTRYLCKNDKDAMDLILLYEPERIHTLVPGVLLLRYLMDQYGAQTVTVSHYGVREGYLHQKIQPALPDNS